MTNFTKANPLHSTHTFRDRQVLITGHTGFKGSWLTLWLKALGAKVTGYALAPDGRSTLFETCQISEMITHHEGDVLDFENLVSIVAQTQPEFIFHLAAQPLVLESYRSPRETLHINVQGTANILDALRIAKINACSVIVVTSDKCYHPSSTPHHEGDILGGHDVYSASKACAEMVVAAWRLSFFKDSHVRLATARAGNVIGAGDRASSRLIPDCVRALLRGSPIVIRNPESARPWQHVLEPLRGYLMLAAALDSNNGSAYTDAWNFGPSSDQCKSTLHVAEKAVEVWGSGHCVIAKNENAPQENTTLLLSSAKAHERLGWKPLWTTDEAIARTINDERALCINGSGKAAVLRTIETYAELAGLLG